MQMWKCLTVPVIDIDFRLLCGVSVCVCVCTYICMSVCVGGSVGGCVRVRVYVCGCGHCALHLKFCYVCVGDDRNGKLSIDYLIFNNLTTCHHSVISHFSS